MQRQHARSRSASVAGSRPGFLERVLRDDLARSRAGRARWASERIDHDVADAADALVGRRLRARRLASAISSVREQQVGEAVGDHAVDLLRHVQIEGAQAGLDVGDADVFLLGRDGAGAGGVDVADDDDPVRPPLAQTCLEGDHGAADLLGVRAGADPEVDVRLRDARASKKARGHGAVVVLAGMDEEVLDARSGPRALCAQWRGQRARSS